MSYTDEIRDSVIFLRYAKGDINSTRLRYRYDRMIKGLSAMISLAFWALVPWLCAAAIVVPIYALIFIAVLISGNFTFDAATILKWLNEMGRWVLGLGFFFVFYLLAQKFR